jgi:hypothetical protein
MSTDPDDKLWDWEEWFDAQYELTERIDKAIAGLTADKDDAFRVALYSAVIEQAAEKMRRYLVASADPADVPWGRIAQEGDG